MSVAKWRDGLYRVECGSFTGEFRISSGHLTRISPCLVGAFDIFARAAQWIAPLSEQQPRIRYAKQDRETLL